MILWRSWLAEGDASWAAVSRFPAGPRTKAARAKGLYDTDINTQIKKSNENPLVLSLYENLLKGREHKLLHRNMAMGDIQG